MPAAKSNGQTQMQARAASAGWLLQLAGYYSYTPGAAEECSRGHQQAGWLPQGLEIPARGWLLTPHLTLTLKWSQLPTRTFTKA